MYPLVVYLVLGVSSNSVVGHNMDNEGPVNSKRREVFSLLHAASKP